MEPKGVAIIKCNECNEESSYQADEVNFELTNSEEAKMDTKRTYTWEVEVNCICENEIKISYAFEEYPTGNFNGDTILEEGGTVKEKFDFLITE